MDLQCENACKMAVFHLVSLILIILRYMPIFDNYNEKCTKNNQIHVWSCGLLLQISYALYSIYWILLILLKYYYTAYTNTSIYVQSGVVEEMVDVGAVTAVCLL